MTCACRQSFNIFNQPKLLFSKYSWKGYNRKLMFEDSFMPIVCKIIGHNPYHPTDCDSEIACKRCHKFISEQDLKVRS